MSVYEISVVSYQGNPPERPITAVFGRDGGTIGRGQANTLVLPDPNRFVSRVQANVTCDNGQMTIANASTANPLLVNDRELEAGAKATLVDGDELRVGLFLLRVRRVTSAPREGNRADETRPSRVIRREAPPRPDPGTPAGAQSDTPSSHAAAPGLGPLDPLQLPFGDASADPFADLMPKASSVGPSSERVPAADAPREQGASTPGSLAPKPASDAAKIPDSVWDDLAHYSPMSDLPPAPPPSALPANFDAFAEPSSISRNPEDPLAEFAQSGVALDSLDKLDMPVDKLFADTPLAISLSDSVIPDPHAAPPDPLANPDTVDPLAMFGDNESPLRIPTDAVFNRSEADDVPELDAFFSPPAARFEQAGRAPGVDDPLVPIPTEIDLTPRSPAAADTPAIPGGPTSSEQPLHREALLSPASLRPPPDHQIDDRLLAELLEGAGIPNAGIKEGLTPELMKRIGAMLAAAVQGTIELIATRALLKREVKADVTIIASTRNNPLKFLPDSESALLQMFGTRIPGFMGPVEAMEDAFKDLRAHEVGLIAGMHAALTQVLARFEPSALEKRLKPAGMLEGLLPNSRQARLWETFEEMYVDISREAQDDFQSLFGNAFLQAYENEISRLKGK